MDGRQGGLFSNPLGLSAYLAIVLCSWNSLELSSYYAVKMKSNNQAKVIANASSDRNRNASLPTPLDSEQFFKTYYSKSIDLCNEELGLKENYMYGKATIYLVLAGYQP